MISILLLTSCSSHLTYIPSDDAAVSSGHFLLFFNEISDPDLETVKPASLSLEIIQEGKTIVSDKINADDWQLYPVPGGVFLVNIVIHHPSQSEPLSTTFNSKVETVNVLNIDFFRVESGEIASDVQINKATYTGKAVEFILDSKRDRKKLSFEQVQRVSEGG